MAIKFLITLFVILGASLFILGVYLIKLRLYIVFDRDDIYAKIESSQNKIEFMLNIYFKKMPYDDVIIENIRKK